MLISLIHPFFGHPVVYTAVFLVFCVLHFLLLLVQFSVCYQVDDTVCYQVSSVSMLFLYV